MCCELIIINMAIKILNYDEFVKSLDGAGRTLLDMTNDATRKSVNKIINDLYNVPSYVYSMMYPKLKFTTGERVINLFYRPRNFPQGGVTERHQDRGQYAGIKSFNLISNEIVGLNKQTQFDLQFEISDAQMLKSGHRDYPDLMEFFKVSRSKPLYLEYGWNLSGIKEVDDAISKLGPSYKVNLNSSNWNIQVSADRISSITVKGWAGINKRDFGKAFIGIHKNSEILSLYEKLEKVQKEEEEKINKNVTTKKPSKVLDSPLQGVDNKFRNALSKAYGQMKDEWIKENKDGWITFGEIIKTISRDLEFISASRELNIIFVLGEYNKARAALYESGNIADVNIPIKDIFDNYLVMNSKSNKASAVQFEVFLQWLVTNYVDNDEHLISGDMGKLISMVGPGAGDNVGVSPRVKINYIPYNDNVYILIDDINRYYNALRVKNTLGIPLDEKMKIAEEENIPIINLERMNTLINYPIDINSHVDEALQSSIMYKQANELKEKQKQNDANLTEKIKDVDINLPYQFYPLSAPFGMWGNFILKPFQALFLTWGSETFDRFYIITKMTHTINDQGQFTANYDTVHCNY